MNIEELLASSDWEEAWKYAPQDVAREDVAAVIASVEGQNDEDSWVGVFRLRDGRYLYLTAWCDYTGWGCQEEGSSDTRTDLVEVYNELCSEDDRRRLDLDPSDLLATWLESGVIPKRLTKLVKDAGGSKASRLVLADALEEAGHMSGAALLRALAMTRR
jgi:hypothetical protein